MNGDTQRLCFRIAEYFRDRFLHRFEVAGRDVSENGFSYIKTEFADSQPPKGASGFSFTTYHLAISKCAPMERHRSQRRCFGALVAIHSLGTAGYSQLATFRSAGLAVREPMASSVSGSLR